MKKLIYLFVVLIVFAFTSCGNSSNKDMEACINDMARSYGLSEEKAREQCERFERIANEANR